MACEKLLGLVLGFSIVILQTCCVLHKKEHYSYIQEVINRHSGGVPPVFVEPPPLWFQSTHQEQSLPPNPFHFLKPKIILWDPICQQTLGNGFIQCPRCYTPQCFLRPVRWKDGKNDHNTPRLLFTAGGGVTYLVSRVYSCKNGHEIVAHDDSILRLFPCKERLPFLLSHIKGITRELYKAIVSWSNAGLKIEQIENLIMEQQLEYFEERREMFEAERKLYCKVLKMPSAQGSIQQFPSCMPEELKGPSNDFICQCIVHDYQEKEILYNQCMAQSTAEWISCDHTFKVAANIGVMRQCDKKWEKQYDSMFAVLNEDGTILAWQLTKGTAFENVEDLFKNLKQRFCLQKKNVNLCVIDNCCSWRGKIQQVFGPEMEVKLDLFHAVQRVVKCIPKRHPFAFHCSQAFRLVMRDPSDLGKKRTLPTPASTVMLENMANFLNTWKDISYNGQPVLPVSAIKEIKKLEKHIHKGCLSKLPVGCGSERNENLHKCIRKAASRGRIGVLLSLALFSSFFYKWNEKQKMRNQNIKSKVVPPITARKAELLNCSSVLTKEKFGIGISSSVKDEEISLPAAYEHCSHSLEEMQDIMERAFDDQFETVDSANESENGTCNFKDIENEAFTIALNLYFLTKHLPESVSNAVNTSHFHLMATNGLFSFGTMLSKDTDTTSAALEDLLHSYGFTKVQVAPDGNCLFTSVIFQLKQMVSAGNANLSKHLQSIGFDVMAIEDEMSAVVALRDLMVTEMIENQVQYEGYLSSDSLEYEQQVKEFLKPGVYAGEVGNLMALSLANVLRTNIVLLTSMTNFPVIPITPQNGICTDKTLYLAFLHFGSGHYDPVVEDVINVKDDDKVPQSMASYQEEVPKGCGCGRGAAKKESQQEGKPSKKFCFQEPGERRTLCPCYRSHKACTDFCRCFNCCNTIGRRPEYGHKKCQVRKRFRHSLQKVETNNLYFMLQKGEEPVDPKWTKFEHILLETIYDRLIHRYGDATNEDVCQVFNSIASIAKSASEVNMQISSKEQAAVTKKMQSVKKEAELFRQFYLKQVEWNFEACKSQDLPGCR